MSGRARDGKVFSSALSCLHELRDIDVGREV